MDESKRVLVRLSPSYPPNTHVILFIFMSSTSCPENMFSSLFHFGFIRSLIPCVISKVSLTYFTCHAVDYVMETRFLQAHSGFFFPFHFGLNHSFRRRRSSSFSIFLCIFHDRIIFIYLSFSITFHFCHPVELVECKLQSVH